MGSRRLSDSEAVMDYGVRRSARSIAQRREHNLKRGRVPLNSGRAKPRGADRMPQVDRTTMTLVERRTHDTCVTRACHQRAWLANPIRETLKRKLLQARTKGVAFNLTEDWLLAHFSQGCEVTGADLEIGKGSPWSAEIDRIKPGGDYTMDNCRVVCAIYNRARMNFTDAQVREFATKLLASPTR